MNNNYCLVVGGSGDLGKSIVNIIHSQKKHKIISTYFRNYDNNAPMDVLQMRFDSQNIDTNWFEIATQYPITCFVFLVGIRSSKNTVVDTPIAEWERLIEINALSFLKLYKILTNNLRKNHSRVIVVSSSAAVDNKANSGPYSASKILLESIVNTLSKEESKYGVGFSIISPSLIDSRLARELVDIKGYDYEEYINTVLCGKILTVDYVAQQIVDIMNMDSEEFCNGQTIYLFP